MKYITLTRGYRTAVDDEDFRKLNESKWSALIQKKIHKTVVYAVRSPSKYPISRMHRLILGAPKEFQVDHKDGDTLNNQKSNLRLVTNQQNQFNCGSKNNKTGFKGVHYMSTLAKRSNLKKPYLAEIMINKKHLYLGYFATPVEAAKAYDAKARELFGEFAKTNF